MIIIVALKGTCTEVKIYVFDSKSLMYYVDLLLAFHTQMEAN